MRIIVTGGNSGIGKATAAALAASGHSVVIACRSVPKAERAAAEMVGDVEVRHLDLADLASVRTFADSVETVDVLVNNAGVMGLPLTRTADGFEANIGTNHLGHFALTCLLGDKITDRVISVTSAMYAVGRIHLDDLNWRTRKYSKWMGYAESKLAVMLFVQELASRGVRAYATDPGATDTDIVRHSTGMLGWLARRDTPTFLVHTPAQGARASIQAVTTDLPSGTYLAPRFNQLGRRLRKSGRRRATRRWPALSGRCPRTCAAATGRTARTGGRCRRAGRLGRAPSVSRLARRRRRPPCV